MLLSSKSFKISLWGSPTPLKSATRTLVSYSSADQLCAVKPPREAFEKHHFYQVLEQAPQTCNENNDCLGTGDSMVTFSASVALGYTGVCAFV